MAAMLQLAGKAAQTTWNSTYEAHTFREESNDSDYMDDEQYTYIYRLDRYRLYRVEVCDSEEVTEMQRMPYVQDTQKHAWRTASLITIKFTLLLFCLIDRSTSYTNTGIFNGINRA